MHSVEHVLKFFDRVIGIRAGDIVVNEKIENISSGTLDQLYEIQEVEDEEISDALS